MANPTGSILVRRGPTQDRLGFYPLEGEIIYDTTSQRFYIGDSVTVGGVGINQRDFPNPGVMIKGPTVDSFLVAPGDPNGNLVQFLSYSKTSNQYQFSSISASGVAVTSLKLTGNSGITATRTDTSPTQSNPTITTTGEVTIDVNATTLRSTLSVNNVTNESKATMFTNPAFTGTVTGVTASMVGLGNVTNESKTTMFSNPNFTGTATQNNIPLVTTTTLIAFNFAF